MNGNYMYYGESSQYTEELTGTLNGESFDWNYIDVNNKKITVHELRDGGTYKYIEKILVVIRNNFLLIHC